MSIIEAAQTSIFGAHILIIAQMYSGTIITAAFYG